VLSSLFCAYVRLRVHGRESFDVSFELLWFGLALNVSLFAQFELDLGLDLGYFNGWTLDVLILH
jgi:hypothetical protein